MEKNVEHDMETRVYVLQDMFVKRYAFVFWVGGIRAQILSTVHSKCHVTDE